MGLRVSLRWQSKRATVEGWPRFLTIVLWLQQQLIYFKSHMGRLGPRSRKVQRFEMQNAGRRGEMVDVFSVWR